MLCQAAGISLDAVSRIENGTRAPTLETVEKLAKGLGVSVAHLIGVQQGAAPVFSPRVMRLACALAACDENMQRTAERVLKLLVPMARPRKPRR